MKKWVIAGLAVLVVLSVSYASYSFLSNDSQAEVNNEVKVTQTATLININTATQAELQSLKGIGPVISKRIIEGRPYNDISDILRVKGIGPKKFARMKDIITIN